MILSLYMSWPNSEAIFANAVLHGLGGRQRWGGVEPVGVWLVRCLGRSAEYSSVSTYFFEVCDRNPALNTLKHVGTKKCTTLSDARGTITGRWGWDQRFRLSLFQLRSVRQG